MSCCPKAPPINVVTVGTDEPGLGAEVERIPGESEDCYVKRAGNVNSTGQVDDKTEEVVNKISQNAVVPDGTATINMQFTMTRGSEPADHWEFTPNTFTGGVVGLANGTLTGTFSSTLHGNKLQVRVKALRADGSTLDDRTYSFSPSLYDSSNSISLRHPLPESVITSKFGPRKPPAAGASSNHFALDFAYANGSTRDVLCAADGETILARPGSGYGNYVMVKHNNAAGVHLITTLYAHLDKIYVTVGQKVGAGQAIGKEGKTGIGSGAHLHFEVRLPDNTKVDPTPYLSGPVLVANGVRPNNTPDNSGVSPAEDGGKAVAAPEVAARQSCAPFGVDYPEPPIPPVPPPPALPTDPFEKAWYFTMTHEVNAKWMTTSDRSPTDPDVAAGLCETQAQRDRTGFIDHPRDPGGVTKFGIANRFNPSVKVKTMPYDIARQTGYNVYWKSAITNCETIAATAPKMAIMLFDMNYLMGAAGAKTVMVNAGVAGTESGAAELAALDLLNAARLSYLKSKPGWSTFGRGWTRRCAECLAYAKAA